MGNSNQKYSVLIPGHVQDAIDEFSELKLMDKSTITNWVKTHISVNDIIEKKFLNILNREHITIKEKLYFHDEENGMIIFSFVFYSKRSGNSTTRSLSIKYELC